MRFAVLTFPGTWSDRDCYHVLRDVLHQQADLVWHRETDLSAYDAIVVPGGFSYGDYLRCGAIARFSPVMEAVRREAEAAEAQSKRARHEKALEAIQVVEETMSEDFVKAARKREMQRRKSEKGRNTPPYLPAADAIPTK